MSLWRTVLTALFATPTLPIHHEVEDAIRRRRETSDFTSRVHTAAQTSALDIISDQQMMPEAKNELKRLDAIDAAFRGRDDR